MAEQKYINLEHLQKLALREKSDYISRIGELTSLVTEALQSWLSVGISITLPEANWADGEQTVTHDYLIADSQYWYFIGPDAECHSAYNKAGIRAGNVTTTGEIKFTCINKPDTDLIVNILRMEVETEDG